MVDFKIGNLLSKTSSAKQRKILLGISLLINLSSLMLFKYYNFFATEFKQIMGSLSVEVDLVTLNVILPVGISFYTFQTLSYTIDVYKKKIEPTNKWVEFMAFVSFFPQLVAGPIERASNLLPQFSVKRLFSFEKAKNGLRQILWGLFMKIVIADNVAVQVNNIFENHNHESGSTLLLGAVFFAFQIYGDFAGYSNIAIGSARILGFDLMQNFAFPYFSRDIAEFWRRWHISLSTWFRDYVYIPLGGSKGGNKKIILNIMIIFLVSGFWHGANWTFLAWGFINAIYFLPLILLERNRSNIEVVSEGRILPKFSDFLNIILTFFLTIIAWIFFRANSIAEAFEYIGGMIDPSILTFPKLGHPSLVFFIVIFVVIEWLHRDRKFGLDFKANVPLILRWSIYYILIILIFSFGGKQQDFIYFQF